MTLVVLQTATAVVPGMVASFWSSGGTGPYTFVVLPGGAGGAIDASTGAYTAPAAASSDIDRQYDMIQVTDSAAATGQTEILVGTPIQLVREILMQELGLADDHCYFWDQKIMQPKDETLYVAISMPSCKPFANVNRIQGEDLNGETPQYINMSATVEFDLISRSMAALDRKEEVLLALNSTYALQQQDANSFWLAKLSSSFLNLSNIDGAAIPYRYKIALAMQFVVQQSKAADYFTGFATPTIVVDA